MSNLRKQGSRINVFAIDPGVTTGWCYISMPRADVKVGRWDGPATVVVTGEVPALDDEKVERWVKRNGADALFERERAAARFVTERIIDCHTWRADWLVYGASEVWSSDDPAARERIVGLIGLDAVVMEGFVIYQQKASALAGRVHILSPARIGSMVGLEIARDERFDGLEVVTQMASMAKGTATDERLRRWGLWRVGTKHARDALRHAVVHIRRSVG